MSPNSNFRLTRDHRILAKKWKLRSWHQIMVGTPLGQNHKNYYAQISNFSLHRCHRFFAKDRNHGYGAKSRWGPFRVHLEANGVPLSKKMALNRKKLPCPNSRIFDYPVFIDFSSKMEVVDMATNHGEDTLGSISGPMGSHWVHKMDQNHKKLPCPKIRIFDCPAVIDLKKKKMEVTINGPNHGDDRLGSILVRMGSHWVKKMDQNRKKLPCPKIRIFDYPAVIDFSKKNGSYSYAAKSWWGTPKVHVGANRVPLGPKNGSKP